ncbi:hypothetical protein [Paraflavitalea speifideaquila]|uniref:hypothetical protein n=1 Tax=Paraflavitalea speifideaquila TaxID=3076558 RepID=UPI0028F082C2|nr:hypothetical protein [Paraflavitalea speifideiaquila]
MNGVLRFPFTIRNQFVTALSTLEGAQALRKEFLNYQREFYKEALAEAAAAPLGGYVLGYGNDPFRTALFVEMLRRHQVEVYELGSNFTSEPGIGFNKGEGYVIPANQPQIRLLHGIFDKTLTYKDSLFYDITAWTMPLAYGLSYAEVSKGRFAPSLLGNKVDKVVFPQGSVNGGKTNYAYLFRWDDYNAPRALYALQKVGIAARVSTVPFQIATATGNQSFGYGTISIPVQLQTVDGDKLYATVQQVAADNGITIYAVKTGNVISGSDLGSSRMPVVTRPAIALLTGAGVNPIDAGEVWYLLDQRFNIPATHLDINVFNIIDLNRYNTMILAGGNYNSLNKDKLKTWVQAGGTLILTEEAVEWGAQAGLTNVGFKRPKKILPNCCGIMNGNTGRAPGACLVPSYGPR